MKALILMPIKLSQKGSTSTTSATTTTSATSTTTTTTATTTATTTWPMMTSIQSVLPPLPEIVCKEWHKECGGQQAASAYNVAWGIIWWALLEQQS